MPKEEIIFLSGIPVTMVRSKRRTLGLEVKEDGSVFLRVPNRCSKRDALRFLESREDWVRAHVENARAREAQLAEAGVEPLKQEELKALTEAARKDMTARVERFAPLVGVTYGRIAIRHQKTRWGSCSSKGNLNFNCLLMLAPEEVRDYIAVHELCHRKEMNHSAAFWREVERVLPDYRSCEAWLKTNGRLLQRRLPVAE